MIERSLEMDYLRNSLPGMRRNSGHAASESRGVGDSDVVDSVCDDVRQALQGLQFGEITITVRNGSVVQIERVARKRQFKSNHREGLG